MKKSLFTLLGLLLGFGIGYAQDGDDTFAQPTHVVGKQYNASGEVAMVLESDFSYSGNGKLAGYSLPDYSLSAQFEYSGDYPVAEYVHHNYGQPTYDVTTLYTYENGLVKTKSILVDLVGSNQYWEYEYYDDGRLKQTNHRDDLWDDVYEHWLYDYGDDGKTVVESYCTSDQGFHLWKKTTSHYDDNFRISSALVESFNLSEELTSSTMTSYSYTPEGFPEENITQALNGEAWVNTTATWFTYDEQGRLTEQLDGVWNDMKDEWTPNHKITFDYSEDGQTYTVSFYKKSGSEWVWDVFENQTILFGNELRAQQRMLLYMAANGPYSVQVNQIEFTLENTNKPVYLTASEQHELPVSVHPNPVGDLLSIEFPSDVTPSIVELYDLQGRRILTQTKALDRIPVEGLPSGTYLVRITMDDGSIFSDKVVKK